VVFADGCAGLVDEIVPGVCDFNMNFTDFGFLLAPVVGAFDFAGELALFPGELFFQLAEAGKRLNEGTL
jgi:hypothetical protein